MINIQGRIYITMKIDGQPLPSAPTMFHKITITEGMGALTPAVELVMNDYTGVLNDELALTDGNELLITVGKTPEDTKTKNRQFRLFGYRQQEAAAGPQVQALGIYDAPEFLTASVRESFEANSQDVLKQIASKCKLTFCTCGDVPTEDKQIWLNVTRTRAVFVQDLVRHARVDDKSALMAVLTSQGELRLSDMNKAIETPKAKIRTMFIHNAQEVDLEGKTIHEVRQARTRSVAGLMNTWQNYGSTRIAHSLEGLQQVFDKLDIHTSSGFLPINEQVAKTVKNSRIEYSPFDCGNNHKNYYKALYQNLRGLALFSEHVSILTTDITDVELLDVVIYKQANADPKAPVNKSDIYVVVGKTIQVKGGSSYAERIELVRRSLTMKGESKLAGTDQNCNAAAQSPVPDSLINPTATTSKDSLPTVAAMTKDIAAAQKDLNAVKVAIPNQSAAMALAMPGMQRMQETINTGTPEQIVEATSKAMPALQHYQEQTAVVNSTWKNSLLSVVKVTHALLDVKGVATGIRQAALTIPGGITHSMSYAFSSLQRQQTMSALLTVMEQQLQGKQSSLYQVPGGYQTMNAFNQLSSQSASATRLAEQTGVTMWNSNASALHGQPIPGTIQYSVGGATLPQVMRIGEVSYDNLGNPVASTATQKAEAMTAYLGTKTALKQPPWIDSAYTSDDPIPASAAEWEFQQLGRDLKTQQGREQDMYPRKW